ncbi:MAG: hypothetical protein ACTH1Z_05350 [Ancrocorticia sp.]
MGEDQRDLLSPTQYCVTMSEGERQLCGLSPDGDIAERDGGDDT